MAATCLGPVLLLLAGCMSDSPSSVSVFPIPGAQVAAPQTQITFRGAAVSDLGKIRVVGSSSGLHAGRLYGDSDTLGGSFVPEKPFTPGELVTVRTGLHVLGAHHGTFHFRIAFPAGPIPYAPTPPAPRVPGDVLRFRSRPDLVPATVELTEPGSQAAPGDLFIAPQLGPVQDGPMIVDPGGQLVWFKPAPRNDWVTDFREQRYAGRPVLTWWQGYVGSGVGNGEDVILDASYRQIAVVHAANGLAADLHEFQLSGRRTALITAYYPIYWNASSVHGAARQVVFDSVVQKIDVPTGLVLFQWDSLDHVPLSNSYAASPGSAEESYDYFHLNGVQQDADGNLMIGSRNTWTAYKVSHKTGAVIWRLGGKHSSFTPRAGASFAFQHDVGALSSGDHRVTVFDDGAGPPVVHDQSRGITLVLNHRGMTATLVRQDLHTPPLLANFEGNVQRLLGGHDLVGWGQQPYFSEFDSRGQMVFDARFVDANQNYRAYRFPWRGSPRSPPAVTASTRGQTTSVYASWNGATDVASWRVLAGAGTNSLRPVATWGKHTFETTIQIPAQPYIAVQALDGSGRRLATSSVVRAS